MPPLNTFSIRAHVALAISQHAFVYESAIARSWAVASGSRRLAVLHIRLCSVWAIRSGMNSYLKRVPGHGGCGEGSLGKHA